MTTTRSFLTISDDDGFLRFEGDVFVHVSYKLATTFDETEHGLKEIHQRLALLPTDCKIICITCTFEELTR